MQTENNVTLTIKGLCDVLHISRPTASNLVKSPGFPVLRIGKRILIPLDSLKEWIAENTVTY